MSRDGRNSGSLTVTVGGVVFGLFERPDAMRLRMSIEDRSMVLLPAHQTIALMIPGALKSRQLSCEVDQKIARQVCEAVVPKDS